MKSKKLRVALVVPHIFMHEDILPRVIFSPGHLALSLANGLVQAGAEVTLYSPGPISTTADNVTADLTLFDEELQRRGESGDSYVDLLRKHPFTFITLARQVQGELIAKAYEAANNDHHDIVHVYTNEEELALSFAALCTKPVAFTHHDPFNFLVKYKNNFPKYSHLNWISLSYAQRKGMPPTTNWVANIYHGLDDPLLTPLPHPARDYVAFLGRIIEPKGVHLAIAAVKRYNQQATTPLKLKIAGKHYAGQSKDHYWQSQVESALGPDIEYVGFLETSDQKKDFLGNAQALLVPSLFDEPFGMVTLEAFACGTPVIALDSGALPEVIEDKTTGFLVTKSPDQTTIVKDIATALTELRTIDTTKCRAAYETLFSGETMVKEHLAVYEKLVKQSPGQS